jgi:hypothetical protein
MFIGVVNAGGSSGLLLGLSASMIVFGLIVYLPIQIFAALVIGLIICINLYSLYKRGASTRQTMMILLLVVLSLIPAILFIIDIVFHAKIFDGILAFIYP